MYLPREHDLPEVYESDRDRGNFLTKLIDKLCVNVISIFETDKYLDEPGMEWSYVQFVSVFPFKMHDACHPTGRELKTSEDSLSCLDPL